jgi:hypothetical protein
MDAREMPTCGGSVSPTEQRNRAETSRSASPTEQRDRAETSRNAYGDEDVARGRDECNRATAARQQAAGLRHQLEIGAARQLIKDARNM